MLWSCQRAFLNRVFDNQERARPHVEEVPDSAESKSNNSVVPRVSFGTKMLASRAGRRILDLAPEGLKARP